MRELQANICPLLSIAGLGGTNSPAMCIQDCCAWWRDAECAIVTMSDKLDELSFDGITMRRPEGGSIL